MRSTFVVACQTDDEIPRSYYIMSYYIIAYVSQFVRCLLIHPLGLVHPGFLNLRSQGVNCGDWRLGGGSQIKRVKLSTDTDDKQIRYCIKWPTNARLATSCWPPGPYIFIIYQSLSEMHKHS